jgi:voltage-gated potassium channel
MESRHGLHPADRPFSLAVRDRFGKSKLSGWRLKIYEVIFESDTPLGKGFDVALIVVILLSVIAVMLESIAEFRNAHLPLLRMAEWVFTIVFTLEYIVRLICVGKPLRYAFSFFGIVDFLAVIPTYLSLLVPGAQYLLIIRLLRVLRIFRVLKLAAYLSESTVLAQALRASRRKIEIFIFTVLTLVVILGSIMYLVEGEENGFTSIPRSIYWAIVTLTTVGYGDISPQTDLGQTLAAFIMIIGYAIIAVPTGIVTAEITRDRIRKKPVNPMPVLGITRLPVGYLAEYRHDTRMKL